VRRITPLYCDVLRPPELKINLKLRRALKLQCRGRENTLHAHSPFVFFRFVFVKPIKLECRNMLHFAHRKADSIDLIHMWGQCRVFFAEADTICSVALRNKRSRDIHMSQVL
jgi:hypothetical protein